MTLSLTHLDKIFWPKEKITKGDLIDYYKTISRYILPYLKNRPLVMRRFPDGIQGESFFQKDAGKYVPSFVKTFTLQHTERKVSYILVQDVKTLLYVVNLGSIELHVFNTSVPHIDNPDYLVLDLDPLGVSFDALVDVALEIHALLEQAKLPHFCKTSGAAGLHIYIPMGGLYSLSQVEQCAYLLASVIHERLPATTSLERVPQKRRKKVYIDYLQNKPRATMACPYSVRAKPYATVSTPLLWKEVKPGLDPRAFTIKTLPQRLAKQGDVFKKVLGRGISLKKVLKSLA